MECPICGSESATTLKSKKISSKSKKMNELLLKCDECSFIFKNLTTEDKPQKFRLIISEHDISKKTFIDLYPSEELEIGNILLSDFGQVEITSLEIGQEKRVEKAIAKNISTIWAYSLELPARVGVSVDFSGNINSYKVDVDKDFKFSVGDNVKIKNYIFKINTIKTLERKTKTGFAKASVTKRIYGKPVDFKRYDYDLTDKIYYSKV